MKNWPITWRFNLGLGVFGALFVAAVYLGYWIGAERERNSYQFAQRENIILHITDRIQDAVEKRAMAVEKIVLQSSETAARQDFRAASEEFLRAVEEARHSLRHESEIIPAIESISDYHSSSLAPLENRLIDLAATDSTAARSALVNLYLPARENLSQNIENLEDHAGSLRTAPNAALASAEGGFVILIIILAIWPIVIARHIFVSIRPPLEQLKDSIGRIGRGDLSVTITLKRHDEFSELAAALNKMTRDLAVLMGQLHQSAGQVNSTARTVVGLSRRQEDSAAEVDTDSTRLQESARVILSNANETGRTISTIAQISDATTDLSAALGATVGELGRTMKAIQESAATINGRLEVLNEKTENINQVVVTMGKVADQTNLLALNAAIEAEKAGNYGRGFAVVAAEIQRLADQTAISAEDIEQVVREIHRAVSSGVINTEQFDQQVRSGVGTVENLGHRLDEIHRQVQTLPAQVEAIDHSAHNQAESARQQTQTLQRLTKILGRTTDSLRTASTLADQMDRAAAELDRHLGRFKLTL